jgi:hypothetical protein
MIEKLAVFVSANLDLQNILNQWSQAGFFSLIIPWLVIFAVTFGILERLGLFGDQSRAINAVIGLSVGFLAIQSDFVSTFFAELFPKFGLGIAIILAAIIFVGMFTENKALWVLFVIGITVFILVIGGTLSVLGLSSGLDLSENLPAILLIVFIIVVITSFTKKERDYTKEPNTSLFASLLKKAGT